MSAVYTREMKSFFNNFTGYITIAFFLLFAGIFVTVNNFFVGSSAIESSYSSTVLVYLFAIPILTMKTMSEEKRAGTDILLRSLPLKTTDYILGKYFAVITMILIPTVIIFSYTLILSFYGSVNIISAIFGTAALYLCGCALAAVGLFISSLTSSMVTSAISCFGAMLLIYFMPALTMLLPASALGSLIAFTLIILFLGVLVYKISANSTFALGFTAVGELILLGAYFIRSEWLEGAVRKLFSLLSVTNRVEIFTTSSILDLSAILYFVTVAFIFVFFTVQSAEKARLG
ncbi:MAG: hypothetical protein E7633_04980 [Ruminococcaceae bacterium]|nr:hypothetical protein [Oscillospiraceae bacterium]